MGGTQRIQDVTGRLAAITDEVRAQFGGMNSQQLNWKPSESAWSVGQCLDHLITTHRLYFPLFEELATGSRKSSVWERISPLSGFFGRMLVRAVDPKNRKKVKTSPKSEPSTSTIDERIVDRFAEHQEGLIARLRALPPDLDLSRTIITSPLLGFVTYSLDDCLTIFVLHAQRHVDQARRVAETPGFN